MGDKVSEIAFCCSIDPGQHQHNLSSGIIPRRCGGTWWSERSVTFTTAKGYAGLFRVVKQHVRFGPRQPVVHTEAESRATVPAERQWLWTGQPLFHNDQKLSSSRRHGIHKM
jgi:hypothetical protein